MMGHVAVFRWIGQGLKIVANSPRSLITCYLSMIVIFGLLYWYFEDNPPEKDVNLGDAVWWAVVTASTVGYGDTYPSTWQGRVLAGVLISVMVLLVIPLITAHFASKLIVDNDAFKHEEQEEIKTSLREIRGLLQRLAEHPAGEQRPARDRRGHDQDRAERDEEAQEDRHAEP